MIDGRAARMSLALLALLLATALATACSTPKNPREILDKSQEAMADLQSYRFNGDIQETDAQGARSVVQSGAWVSPDRYHLKLESPGHIDELIVVGLQARSYDSDYPERGWQEQPLIGAGIPIPNFEYLEDLTNLKVVKEEVSIDGIPVYHIVGKLPRDEDRALRAREHLTRDDPFRQEKLVSIVRWSTSFDIYVSKNDHRVLRVVHALYMEGWETATDAMGIKTFRAIPLSQRTQAKYFDFDAAIAIDVPQ